MNYKELADMIFPDAKEISYYEEKYPKRNLPEGAIVTRYAPSPTGVMHIGGLYQSLIAKTIVQSFVKEGGPRLTLYEAMAMTRVNSDNLQMYAFQKGDVTFLAWITVSDRITFVRTKTVAW